MSAADGSQVVVVGGCRTPFLKANTDFRQLTSYDLAREALKGLQQKTHLDPELVDRVIMGTVISNMSTSNVAREALLGSGLSQKTPAFTVTQACISANVAISCGVDLIRSGQARVVIAGGTESMSDVPIKFRKKFRQRLVDAQRYRKPADWLGFFKGLKPSDLLPEIPSISEFSTGLTMGEDCDRLAARIGVTRDEQDRFAVRSHQAAARAAAAGILAEEIIPVRQAPKFKQVDTDNGVRGDSSMEKLARLKPAFVKKYGTITAANASYLTDGAAAVLLMDKKTALAHGYTPRATVCHYCFSAQDPGEELLLGPAYAISHVLEKAGLRLDQIDVIELHEAFAGQVLANLKCLESPQFATDKLGRDQAIGTVPMDKLNVHGGSLSLGHPFGATGARLVTTASNRLHRENGRYALVAACAAGAMGHAMILERY